jgi:glycosyltransferase involved in cell wall biosynthesis
MKILHLSTFDVRGGAARSAYRLHHGMLAAGIESRMLVRSKWGLDTDVTAFTNTDFIFNRLFRYVLQVVLNARVKSLKQKVKPGFDPFSIDRTRELIKCGKDIDIINLHWVTGFVDPSNFFKANHTVPVVWRFSDLNPITGGCHYDSNCGKYLTECQMCPQLGSLSDRDISYEIWHRKKKAFDRIPLNGLHLVAQSTWMAEQMKKSPLVGRFPVTVIANGVDADIYRPLPRPGLRSSLGISDNDFVILFVANSTSTKRKGLSLLIDALEQIDLRLWLLSVGDNEPLMKMKHKHIWLGKVDSDIILSAIYNTADIYALPSLQDNLPNTAIESLLCGTPVVGFDSGGLCDIVESGLTGSVVSIGCGATALAEAIGSLAKDRQTLKSMRVVCREQAVKKFHLTTQVGLFKNLYNRILSMHMSPKNKSSL